MIYDALQDKPENMVVTTHVYRGNFCEAVKALGDSWNTDVWIRWTELFSSLAQEKIQLPTVGFRKTQGNERTVGAIDLKIAPVGDREITLCGSSKDHLTKAVTREFFAKRERRDDVRETNF